MPAQRTDVVAGIFFCYAAELGRGVPGAFIIFCQKALHFGLS